MAIMKSIRCFPLELNFTSTKSPTVLLNKNQIYIVCVYPSIQALASQSIYLSIYIFWAFISLQDLLWPFSNPCILSIMPHVFANTNFADIHFHSKIHLGQSLHTRKCNRKHRIEWNILQTPQHCKSEIRNDNRAEMFDEFVFHDDDKNRAFVYCWLDDDDDNDDDDYDNDSCLCSHFDHSIAVYIFFVRFV